MEVRTRFAPSPTGYMHIGNLRTALYCYLFAKHNDGKFILRIEDTDKKRYVDGAVDVIYDTLKQTKLTHDEGPDVGGEYGPYIQTERIELYQQYAHQLIESGHAYYCFCKKSEDLEEENQESYHTGYCKCRNLSPLEVKKLLESKVPYVIRQKIPSEGQTSFYDELYGEITVDNSTLDDQILIKSDGLPTYNFANVIDDHLMNITHILRGKEYISSSPKYQLLYDALGWTSPKMAHLSTIMGMNEDGTVSKLSKRHGAVSFSQLVQEGYLPEAIINYIALLGWSPKSEQEIFSMSELIDNFNLSGLIKTNAIFDYKKLAWINGEYIKRMSHDEFEKYSESYISSLPDFIKEKWGFVSTLLQSRINVFNEIPEKLKFLNDFTDFDLNLLINKKNHTTLENSKTIMQDSLSFLNDLNSWTADEINQKISQYTADNSIKIGTAMWPLRIAVTGEVVTPGGCGEMMQILGKKECFNRINRTINRILALLQTH